MDQRFSRRNRLRTTEDFSSVLRHKCSAHTPRFTLRAKPNGLGYGRLGVAVGRKAARRAVARNYMKRVIRETFRRHQAELAGLDLVVLARARFGRSAFAEVQAELRDLFTRVARCRASSGS